VGVIFSKKNVVSDSINFRSEKLKLLFKYESPILPFSAEHKTNSIQKARGVNTFKIIPMFLLNAFSAEPFTNCSFAVRYNNVFYYKYIWSGGGWNSI
jgi:hypothetical protein